MIRAAAASFLQYNKTAGGIGGDLQTYRRVKFGGKVMQDDFLNHFSAFSTLLVSAFSRMASAVTAAMEAFTRLRPVWVVT